MNSFEPGFIQRQPITQGLIKTIRTIGEYKGKQDLFRERAPQVLRTLRQAAIIQSTESSNRIEGIVAPAGRIKALVANETMPLNRSEQEIAGYRDVLKTIHVNYENMSLTTGLVLQLHRDLYRFTAEEGGRWKDVDNDIVEYRPDGTRIVRFRPVPAFRTAEAMECLQERFQSAWHSGDTEPLLLIAAYILDFLCIHPFRDGNGRMARLLSLLLLYRAGYDVGRYVSLELMVERTRDGYYDSLQRSSEGWHECAHSLLPWWEYFLGVMLLSSYRELYRELEGRVDLVTHSWGAKTRMVRDAIDRLPGTFHLHELERACPGVSRPTIKRVLKQERESGRLKCIKTGRNALWEKT